MASPRRSPTVRRRQLSAELRTLRDRSGLTQTEVTKRLEWSQGKLARMERDEWLRPDPHDIRLLLDVYEVTDEDYREELLSWAREGRQQGWWHPHQKLLGGQYSAYIGLEAEAADVLSFSALMMPGLLQTADYARALIQGWQAEIPADEVQRRVDVRMKRQEILTREDPLRLWAVMDEAVLHRRVGSADIMRDQLRHLLDMAKLPRVTLQVIPFDAGAHPGAAGPFTILKFPDLSDPEAVFVENLAGELYVEKRQEVEEFQRGFQRLVAVALSPEATIGRIAEQVKT